MRGLYQLEVVVTKLQLIKKLYNVPLCNTIMIAVNKIRSSKEKSSQNLRVNVIEKRYLLI